MSNLATDRLFNMHVPVDTVLILCGCVSSLDLNLIPGYFFFPSLIESLFWQNQACD